MKKLLTVLLLCWSWAAWAQPILRNSHTTNSPGRTPNILATSTNVLYPLMVLNPDGSGGDRQILFNEAMKITGTNTTLGGNLSLNGRTNIIADNGSTLTYNGSALGGGDSTWTNAAGAFLYPVPSTNFFHTIRPSGSVMVGTNASNYFVATFSADYEPLFFNFRDTSTGDKNFGLFYSEATDSPAFNSGGLWQTDVQTNIASSKVISYGSANLEVGLYADNTGSGQQPGAWMQGIVNNRGWLFVPDAAATNTPYKFDTTRTHTSSNLLHVANNGTNKFTVLAEGQVTLQGKTNQIGDNGTAMTYNGVPLVTTNVNEFNITNGNVWNSFTIKNGATLNMAGGNLAGDAYVIVGGSANALTNGLNLDAAYTAAKTKTPHGAALSAGNRYTIFLVPGVFDMGAGSLTLDTQFIDIVGISPNTGERLAVTATSDLGDTVITSSTKPVNVTAASQDITIANVCLKTTTAGTDSCIETSQAGFGAGFKVINVFLAYAGAGNRITQWDKSFNGYWEDVRAQDVTGSVSTRAFGASVAGSVIVNGTFIRCIAENSAWGGENNNGVTLSGTFIDCQAGAASFCGTANGGTLSGTFLRCRPGASQGAMFGSTAGTLSGYFEGCVGAASFNAYGATMSGVMRNCAMGAITDTPSWTSVTGTIVGFSGAGWTANVTASRDTNGAVAIAASGWTNTFGKNATVYFDGGNITFTVFNSALVAMYTNAVAVSNATVNLQPLGKVIITGDSVTGRAMPL